MTANETAASTQVYRVYIKATPQAIWDAITKPEWTARYSYTGLVNYDLKPGGAYKVYPTEPYKAASEAQGYPVPEARPMRSAASAQPTYSRLRESLATGPAAQ